MINYDGLYRSDAPIDKSSCFSQEKLGFKIIENGTILPHEDAKTADGNWTWGKGGIVDSEENFVKGSFVTSAQVREIYTPVEEIPYFDTTVVYLAMYFPVWGHCITDEIRGIWFFRTDTYKKQFASCPIIINSWDRVNNNGGGGDTTPIYKVAQNSGSRF